MKYLLVFIGLVSLFYQPFSGANFEDSIQECEKSFASSTTENSHQRVDSLLAPISVSSSNEVAEMLKQASPETLRTLTKRVFDMRGMTRAKYNLAYVLGAKQTDDPEIHRILAEALLWEAHIGVVRKVAQALGQINGKIDPKDSEIQWNLVKVVQLREEIEIRREAIYALGETRSKDPEIHSALVDILLTEAEEDSIRQTIVKALVKIKPTNPGILQTLFTALLSEDTTDKTKQFAAEVLGEMPLPKPKLHEMARLLCRKTEFESDQSIKLKQKIAEAIKKTESRNFKLHELLGEALTVLKEERYIKARGEIYNLFEAVSQHIKVKIERRLAGMIDSDGYSSGDKLRIIGILKRRGILKHGQLIDVLTVQRLSEGLFDSSSEVRGATVEALGDILLIPAKPNFLKGIYDKAVYPLLVHPTKNLFNGKDTIKNIRHYILRKLADVAENDPDPLIQETAVQAIVKMDDGSASVDMITLIQRFPLKEELPDEEALQIRN